MPYCPTISIETSRGNRLWQSYKARAFWDRPPASSLPGQSLTSTGVSGPKLCVRSTYCLDAITRYARVRSLWRLRCRCLSRSIPRRTEVTTSRSFEIMAYLRSDTRRSYRDRSSRSRALIASGNAGSQAKFNARIIPLGLTPIKCRRRRELTRECARGRCGERIRAKQGHAQWRLRGLTPCSCRRFRAPRCPNTRARPSTRFRQVDRRRRSRLSAFPGPPLARRSKTVVGRDS